MTIDYDIRKIDKALFDFYNAVGIRIELLKDDFSPVSSNLHEICDYCLAVQSCSRGKDICIWSDTNLLEKCKATKKTQVHICHAGLVDVATPILYNDIIIGYIIFGQIKTDTDFSVLKDYIKELGLDEDKMEYYYSSLLTFKPNRIESITNLASMLVKHILLENMLKPALNNGMRAAVDYIDKNLERDMSIKEISSDINVSKSVLYKQFHDKFNCTVNEYIKRKRIEKSIKLIEKDGLSIEEISQSVGFSSASYFSKIFKAYVGKSPLQYKKLYCKNK